MVYFCPVCKRDIQEDGLNHVLEVHKIQQIDNGVYLLALDILETEGLYLNKILEAFADTFKIMLSLAQEGQHVSYSIFALESISEPFFIYPSFQKTGMYVSAWIFTIS